mmetsp:Transcript_3539/g.10269  ORF Transcript_3539/g.10269 Transcript_3539/m.10269 type:complete len:85 (-) Transcript_3539:570-824(-)
MLHKPQEARHLQPRAGQRLGRGLRLSAEPESESLDDDESLPELLEDPLLLLLLLEGDARLLLDGRCTSTTSEATSLLPRFASIG